MVNNEKQEKLRYGPVNYVDPNIGTLGHLLTSTKPILSLPHGMVQCYPALHKKVGGDRYVNECVHGFSVGTLVCMPAPAGCAQAEYASSIDHDFEETTPFSYKVLLEKDDMWTELAVTRNCLLGKVQYINKNGAAFLLKGPSDMHASVKNENCITVTVGEEGRSFLNSSSAAKYVQRIFMNLARISLITADALRFILRQKKDLNFGQVIHI